MTSAKAITFVVAVNDRELLRANLLFSPFLREPGVHHLLIQENFDSASHAYNDAIDRSFNDLVVFAHQDVIFPEAWLDQLEAALAYLQLQDPRWGVLGCYGETRDHRGRGYIYSSAQKFLGAPFEHPAPVQTLDEIVLILRKSSGLRFSEHMPHFHLYGADICLGARKRGMKSYAIPAFCIHNTQQYPVLPNEFYACYLELKHTWAEFLPIQTTCIRVTKSDIPMYVRRLRELYLRHICKKRAGLPRHEYREEDLKMFNAIGSAGAANVLAGRHQSIS